MSLLLDNSLLHRLQKVSFFESKDNCLNFRAAF